MNALWKEPVTTAASTTLAHLLVPATEGTHSMASPTVAVSGLALDGSSRPGAGPPLRFIFLYGTKSAFVGSGNKKRSH